MTDSDQKFETWAVVEMMGHKRLAGCVTETVIAGVGMLRVDVPETAHHVGRAGGPVEVKPGYTKIIHPASIYCLTPCTEDVGRRIAQELERYNDPLPVSLPRQLAPVSSAGAEVEDEWQLEIDEIDDPGLEAEVEEEEQRRRPF